MHTSIQTYLPTYPTHLQKIRACIHAVAIAFLKALRVECPSSACAYADTSRVKVVQQTVPLANLMIRLLRRFLLGIRRFLFARFRIMFLWGSS